jgi:opacity protein-like surface antigen
MKMNLLPWNCTKLALGLALALSLTLTLAAPAEAQDVSSFYVTPKVMASYQKADMKGGHERSSVFGMGGSVGSDLSYSTSLPLRLEVEYLYHGSESYQAGNYTHDLSAHSILANGFFDLQTDTALTPYIGGGVGLAYLNDHVTGGMDVKAKSWNFAWNAGGGLAWGVSENLAVDLGYRYMDLGKTDKNSIPGSTTADVALTAHEFSLGLRIMGF